MINFFKKQYKSHLIRNLSNMCALIVAYILISSVFVLSVGWLITRSEKQLEFKEKLGYDYVVESTTREDALLCYYKLDTLVTIEGDNGNKIHTNFYMDTIDSCDSRQVFATKSLSENQIEISRKVAEKIGVSVGDKVYVHLSIFNDPQVYIVAIIGEYIDDFYDYSDDSDFSVAAIPYTAKIADNAKGRFVGFYTQEEYAVFYDRGISYSEIYNVENEFQHDSTILMFTKIVCGIVYVLFAVVFSVIAHKRVFLEIRKYFVAGMGYKKVKTMHLLDKIVFEVSPLLFPTLFIAIGCMIGIVSVKLLITLFLVFITQVIAILVWREGYEKAN